MARSKDTRLPYQRIHDESISEAALQNSMLEVAQMNDWKCHHETDSRRSNPGFPDLVCVHPTHGVVFIELKTEKKYLRAPQRVWRDVLVASGARYYLFRPRDRFVADEMFLTGKFPPVEDYLT